MTRKETDYNGWKNRDTWNVALWINNDYGLYCAASDFMSAYKGRQPYTAFVESIGYQATSTLDGIAWLSSRLSYRELNVMMRELRPEAAK